MVGQSQPQTVFEIMGSKGELTPEQTPNCASRYGEGLAAYRAQRFDEARKAFGAALESVPGDGPSAALLARLDGFAPPADWNGAWHLESK